MVPWSSPGDILRWWRNDVLRLPQQQVADRLSVKPTALSNWENNTRAISIDIEQLDRLLDGDGVLAGLLWALRTPTGLDSSRVWTKVFPGESTPVWMWIRSPASKIHVQAEWGVARVDEEFELGPNGLFLTVPMSLNVSPIIVYLAQPGWADFGRGELPDTVPGADVLAAINHAERSSGSGAFYEMFFGNMGDRFSRSRSLDLARLNKKAPRLLSRFFSAFGRSERAPRPFEPWPPVPSEPDVSDRIRFARLRRARGLSLVDAANRLAAVTGVEVSKDTLRRFETDIGDPHDRLLPVALDHMLGAEGHLAKVEIRADRGEGVVRFPPYWHGPVWFQFEGPPSPVTIQLVWGEWTREVEGPLPLLLVYHFAERGVPLRIIAPPSISWQVGVGRRVGGIAIHHDWSPISVDTVQRTISDTDEALLRSLADGQRRSRDADGNVDPDDARGGSVGN